MEHTIVIFLGISLNENNADKIPNVFPEPISQYNR